MAVEMNQLSVSQQCIDNLTEDFVNLDEMKSFVIEELNAYQNGTLGLGQLGQSYDRRKGLIRNFPDGRKARTLLLHGHEYTYNTLMSPPNKSTENADSQLWFVGFFGERRRDICGEIPTLVWNLSRDLDEECVEFPSMLSVCFAETRKGSWYNLVLMQGEKTLGDWHSSRLHRFAVRDLAPRYYAKVRIHVGRLPQGITTTRFNLKRSIYLDYTMHQEDNDAPIDRSVKHWSDDVPVANIGHKTTSSQLFTFDKTQTI